MNTRKALGAGVALIVVILVIVAFWPRGMGPVVQSDEGSIAQLPRAPAEAEPSPRAANAEVSAPVEATAESAVVAKESPAPPTELIDTEQVAMAEGAGALLVRVVEEGTRIPLERVSVSLWSEGDGYSVRRLGVTDAEGRTLFADLTPGEYGMNLRWMMIPGAEPFNVSATVKSGETTRAEFDFPQRDSFLFRLIDPEGNPIAGHALKVGFTTTNPFDHASAVYEDVVTAADGTFFGLGYADQLGWTIRSDEPMLLKKANFPTRREEHGLVGPGDWDNPASFPRDSMGRDDFVQDVVGLRDLVMVEGVLIGARELGPNVRYLAYVMGADRRVKEIPIEDNRFTFTAAVSSRLAVSICTLPDHAATPPPMATHGSLKPFDGTLELLQEITLPDEPGPFTFEMRYPDPVIVTGRVLDPTGEGVAGVEVIVASAMDREPFDFIPSFAQRDIESITRRSEATNSRGDFTIEAPPDLVLDFYPDLGTVPDDLRTHRELRRTAQELLDEPEVTLHLQYSSLLWGEVVNAEGEPVPNAKVELFPFENPRVPVAATTANEDGIFELNAPVSADPAAYDEPVVSQDYYLSAGSRGTAQGFAAVVLNTSQPTTIVMRGATSIVVEAPEGTPAVMALQVSASYTVPGVDRRIEGYTGNYVVMSNRTLPAPRVYTRLEITRVGREGMQPFVIDIPEDAESVMTIVLEE